MLHAKQVGTESYIIKRLFKVGNDSVMNQVFEEHKSIGVKKIGPLDSACGYTAYAFTGIKFENGEEPIAFEMSTASGTVGLVRSRKKNNAILFKKLDEGIVEVYVFADRYSSSSLLLQMLNDGAFNQMIENIKKKVA
jgi:hypothetical protein